MIPAAEYRQLTEKFKESLTESAVLNKAARLSAEKQAMLTYLPPDVAVPQIKPLSREIGILTKRIRQGPISRGAGDDEDDDDVLLHVPGAVMFKKLMKSVKKEPKTPQQTHKRPGSRLPRPKRLLPTVPPSPKHKKGSSSASPELAKKLPTPKDLYKKPKKKTEVEKLKPQQGWEDWGKGKKLKRPLSRTTMVRPRHRTRRR